MIVFGFLFLHSRSAFVLETSDRERIPTRHMHLKGDSAIFVSLWSINDPTIFEPTHFGKHQCAILDHIVPGLEDERVEASSAL